MKSLKTKIIAVVLLCSIAAVGICGGMSIREVSGAVNENSKELLSATAESQKIKLDENLSMIAQSVDCFTNMCLEELKDFEEFKDNDDYVEKYTKRIQSIAEQFALNTQGALTCYVRYNPEFTEPTSGIFLTRDNMESDFTAFTPTDFSQYDPSDTEHVGWYYIPVNNGKPTWMDPYLNANINVYMISYVVPLFIDGESVGIVGMDIDFSMIQELIGNIGFLNTGYAFLTNSEDNMLYHKEIEVGTSLSEDKQFEALVQTLDNADSEGKTAYYTYKNKENCMVYQSLQNGMKLVLTAPKSEFQATTVNLIRQILFAAGIAILLSLIVGVFFSIRITVPLKKITGIVSDTAELDFTPNPQLGRLCNIKDETGGIAKAVQQMQNRLNHMITEIQSVNSNMDESMKRLGSVTSEVVEICDDNSATTQELAATMQETAAATEGIYQNVTQITENAEEISGLSTKGYGDSKDVHERAVHMQEMTRTATDRTKQMYKMVRHQSDEALEQAKAVEKIKEMTTAITEISSQTNLLALNASIEAARAGEAGRGFSVVATEIGNLANQTLDTVTNIDGIVKDVFGSVRNMGQCLENSTEFLEKTVLSDYTEFKEVSDQYTEDALVFKDSMEKIQSSVRLLSETMVSVSQAVGGINTAVNEATDGISNIADKTSEMTGKVSIASSDVNENKKSMERFEAVIGQFKLNRFRC